MRKVLFADNESIMKKAIDWIDDRKIAILAMFFLIISLIPFFYLSHYVRPGGDDFGYAKLTRAAWLDTGSLLEVLKAAFDTAKNTYEGWGGYFVSIFITSLMPEIFAPYTFWIACYFILLINIISTAVFIYYFLGKVSGIGWEYTSIIYAVVFFILLQYIPSYNTGVYWYIGALNYILPHSAFLLSLVFAHLFILTKAKKYILLTSICSFIIGGISLNYCLMYFLIHAILIALQLKKNKTALWLLIPYAVCLVGFIIMVKAPGNDVRARGNFGFSIEYILVTIWRSITQELVTPIKYFNRVPLIIIIFFVIIVFGWLGLLKAINARRNTISFRYPLIYIIGVFLLNCAMNAPRIYSVELLGVPDASSGPRVVEWLFFLLSWMSAIIYLEGWLLTKLLLKKSNAKPLRFFTVLLEESYFRKCILFPFLLLCLLLLVNWKSTIKESFAYQAYKYVESGQAAEYKMQIAEYMVILLDDNIEEAYLKPINDKQGPVLHWTVMDDEDNFVNWAYKVFYRKKLVVIGEPHD